jgi:hypothetical protein
MPRARSAAIHVCTMNNAPTSTSDSNAALPTDFSPPRLSSARVEMPSKPRNDNTAIEVAPTTVDSENTCGS